MKVQLEYTVPVMCLVDTDTGTIDKVDVLDDELRLAGLYYDERGNPLDPESPGRSEFCARAREIADHSGQGWPAWRMGN
jgi:hypothetical protein